MIEKHLSLREAARRIGIQPQTLKRWMHQELGIIFPRVRHGAKLIVLESDVEVVLERKRDARRGRNAK